LFWLKISRDPKSFIINTEIFLESTFKPNSYITVIIKFKQNHIIPDSQSWQCSYIFSSLDLFSIPQCCWLSGWVNLSSAPRCSYNMYFSNIIFWKCLTSFWVWIELQHHFLSSDQVMLQLFSTLGRWMLKKIISQKRSCYNGMFLLYFFHHICCESYQQPHCVKSKKEVNISLPPFSRSSDHMMCPRSISVILHLLSERGSCLFCPSPSACTSPYGLRSWTGVLWRSSKAQLRKNGKMWDKKLIHYANVLVGKSVQCDVAYHPADGCLYVLFVQGKAAAHSCAHGSLRSFHV